MANRPVHVEPDRSVTLVQGRFYRLLVIVNGEPGDTQVRAAILAWGLDGTDTAISWPGDWPTDRPPDWPDEHIDAEGLPANEFLLRVSGSMAGRSRTIGADWPIAGDIRRIADGRQFGTLTIAEAWDCGPATAARPPSSSPGSSSSSSPLEERADDENKSRRSRTGLVVGVGLAFAAALVWKFGSSRRQESEEEERMRTVQAQADHARREARIRELVGQGHEHTGARAIAEDESYERAAERERSEEGY